VAPLAQYILMNRVRAGLAGSVLDEPFVGSQTLSVDEMLRLVGEATV
jgi:hypothetical protein